MSTQPDPTASGDSNSSDSLTESQLVHQLLGASQPQEQNLQAEETETEVETETETEAILETEEVETEETQTEDDDLIAQLLASDPEKLKEIARLAGSKSIGRYGELTAKIKNLEAQLQSVPQETAKPLPEALPNNPFRGLDAKQVAEKRKDLEKVADTIESLLDDNDDLGNEDEIQHGGETFTKKQLKEYRRNVTRQLSQYIPDQLAEIQRVEQRETLTAQFAAAIPIQVPEMADENSEVASLHKGFMADPLIQRITKEIPDLSPQLPFILAHAAKNIIASRNAPQGAAPAPGQKARPKVAASPVGAVATPTRTVTDAKIKEKESKFLESGRADDLVAMFAAKHR